MGHVLFAYYQINVDKKVQQRTTFMLPLGRFFFKKTVMGSRLRAEGKQ